MRHEPLLAGEAEREGGVSWREHWPYVNSSVRPGDMVSGCRDNDTKTYRLFVNNGVKWINKGHLAGAFHLERSMSCDLSVDDVRELARVLQAAVDCHEPWPEHDDE
jgi:hypothetical protein